MASAFVPDVSLWDAWRPREVARRLSGVDVPWAVVAGWSLDLFRGEETRVHEDIEIAVPRDAFPAILDALAEFEHFALIDGRCVPIGEDSLETSHQTWVRDDVGRWRLDVLREPWEGDTWICRRDERLRRAREDLIAFTQDGIPYQRPEIALLFKAKYARPKDEADFASVLPLLDERSREWLSDALEVVHPGHRWLGRIRM